jgi:hypothetical protein
MRRPFLGVIFLTFLAFSFQGAQAQVQFHGVPASVTSPGPDGTPHGVPASVTSPTPVTPSGRPFVGGQRFRVRFGNPRRHHQRDFVPVPVFIPAYPYPDYVSEADPPVADQRVESEQPDTNADAEAALRDAYNRGAHDALARQQADSRYGTHYMDSREKDQSSAPLSEEKKSAKPSPRETAKQERAEQEAADNTPATVFIFKDGHKLQTRNFAILGQTLFDFTDKPLRKIKLAELDLDATRKANDDLGIDVRLPAKAEQ